MIEEARLRSQIAKRGRLMFAIGSVVFAVIVAAMYWLRRKGYEYHFAAIPACVPVAIAGVGLIEWVSRTPMNEMGQQWTHLEGWQRGVILASLIGIALAILVSAEVFVLALIS